MKELIRKRLVLAAQISLVVAQIAGIVYALDAKASDSSAATVAREVVDYRIEIQQRARSAVKMTQSETAENLETSLNNEESSSAQLAGNPTGNSG